MLILLDIRMKLFNSLCKVINMNVNKWKRKERNRKKRKG